MSLLSGSARVVTRQDSMAVGGEECGGVPGVCVCKPAVALAADLNLVTQALLIVISVCFLTAATVAACACMANLPSLPQSPVWKQLREMCDRSPVCVAARQPAAS